MKLKHVLAAAAVSVSALSSSMAAEMILNNIDPAGAGFNDPRPATPVGGNTGTTVGAQRLIAFRKALELWGKTLASPVRIVVRGTFTPQLCTLTGAVLASAGAVRIAANFPNAPLQLHWYPAALANAIAGVDLNPGPLDAPDVDNDDEIRTFFNSNLDAGNPNCLGGASWYYGLDNNAPTGQIDFLDTFMHEVSHGLGFANFVAEDTGARPLDLPDVYMANTLDLSTGQRWNQIAPAAIVQSALRSGKVVWAGPTVTANAPGILGPYVGVRLSGSLNEDLDIGTAAFGPVATAANFQGQVIVSNDGAGVSVTDGCEAIGPAVAGKVAYVDRGNCTFAVKTKNAQNAGATAVIIGANGPTGPFGMSGVDPTITIPAVSVSQVDGTAIKAAPTPPNAAFVVDPSRRAGASGGYARLFAPPAVQLGSSISHFDSVASPNLLMEPAINADLRSARNLDLTPSLMQDIGWNLETLKIGFCDTGVRNAMPDGALLHVKVEECRAGAKNHGQFLKCMNHEVTQPLVAAGWISGSQKGAITSCAAQN